MPFTEPSLAGAGVSIAGVRGTGDWGIHERPTNFREYIMFMNPNGTAPLTALLSRVATEVTDDPRFNWWTEPVGLVRVRVNGNHADSATTITLFNDNPSAGDLTTQWGGGLHLKPGDVLMVEPAADTQMLTAELLKVLTVVSATSITVTREYAGTTKVAGASSIPAGAFLLLVGSAYSEGTRAPDSATRNPIMTFNYTQIWKDTYEITGTAKETHSRTGDPIKNDKKRKAWDHARGMELGFLFGRKWEGVGANNKPERTTGGLRSFIPASRSTIFGASVTFETFLDAVHKVFDYDTPAGDTRIAFAGNSALNAINKAIKNDPGVNVNYGPPIKLYGMRLNQLILPQGTIFIKTHPLFNLHAVYSSSMMIIDFASLKYRPMKNRDTKFKNDVEADDEDTTKGFWQTEAGLEVHYGGLTNAWLGNITFTPPE